MLVVSTRRALLRSRHTASPLKPRRTSAGGHRVSFGVLDLLVPVQLCAGAAVIEFAYRYGRSKFSTEHPQAQNREAESRTRQTVYTEIFDNAPFIDSTKKSSKKNTKKVSADVQTRPSEREPETFHDISSLFLPLAFISTCEAVKFISGNLVHQKAAQKLGQSLSLKQFLSRYAFEIMFKSKHPLIALSATILGVFTLSNFLSTEITRGEIVKCYLQCNLLSEASGIALNFVTRGPSLYPIGGHAYIALYGLLGFLLHRTFKDKYLYLLDDSLSVSLPLVMSTLVVLTEGGVMMARGRLLARGFAVGPEVTLSAFLLGSLYCYVRPNYRQLSDK